MKKNPPMRILEFHDSLSAAYRGTTRRTYLYRDRETSELIGLDMCLGEKMAREKTGGFIDSPEGRELVRALREELELDGIAQAPKPRPRQHAQWPMVSSNAGVNPEEADRLRQLWQAEGITGCEVLPNGDIKYDSRYARKRDFACRGLFDKAGGYGDQMPQNL